MLRHSTVADSAGEAQTEPLASVNPTVFANKRLVEGVAECLGAELDSSSSSQGLSLGKS